MKKRIVVNDKPGLFTSVGVANGVALLFLMVLVLVIWLALADWPPSREWWAENAADLIGTLITAIGLIVGAVVVVYQLGAQHVSSLNVQRDGKREELKLKIYEAITTRVRAYIDASLDLKQYLRSAVGGLIQYDADLKAQKGPAPIAHRALKALAMRGDSGMALVSVVTEIEKWELSIERLDIFRFVLTSTNYDVSNTFHELFGLVSRLFPIDSEYENGTRIIQPPLTDELLGRLEAKLERFISVSDDLDSYVFDLTVECQNALISTLFGRKVQRRMPLDPRHVVITNDEGDYERLVTMFRDNSALGQVGARAREEHEARRVR